MQLLILSLHKIKTKVETSADVFVQDSCSLRLWEGRGLCYLDYLFSAERF